MEVLIKIIKNLTVIKKIKKIVTFSDLIQLNSH